MGKFTDAMFGLIVADAVGVPFEFKPRDTFKCEGMTGFGTYNMPPGTWSDDSSMTLATADMILAYGGINLEAIMSGFYRWLYMGRYTPYGSVFDVGNTTRSAIHRYRFEGVPVGRCGGDLESDNGNGSLMRILPLAFIPHSTQDIHDVSALTHAHEISRIACEIYIHVAENLLNGYDKQSAVAELFTHNIPGKFSRVWEIANYDRDEIKSTGYVVDTLEAALWCLTRTNSYKECILTAVNLGGDTDTVAAVAGGLAGIVYGIGGEKGIPVEWIEKLAQKQIIKNFCKEFEFYFNGEEWE